MNNLHDHQTQSLKYEHMIDFDMQNIVGFILSKDLKYIVIITHSQQDIQTLQIRIYQTQSFQLIITFNISQINLKIDKIFFSNDSSYLYYYSHFNHLNLLNLQDLTFKTILMDIQSKNQKHYFCGLTLFIKEEQKLHIYNIQNQQKIEQLRFEFPFSHFIPFSSNQYFVMNDTQQTLEVWFNYQYYFKNKISKQFSKIPNKIVLIKNHLILCVFMFRSIQFLSQNNFHILMNIQFINYFMNQQLYIDDKITIIRAQNHPPKLEQINLFPQISNSQLLLENDFLEQFDIHEQTSKLLIGINFKESANFKLKIYKLQF
ncbi:unnamed protein product [Paramecium pentaurelia]|uniref:Uncharacterized protein n=1 Tax=Paramecium pentaurelia TaxID=43138 RepID=A0A8S1VTH6_9CILI|nr:unnamed protein product [Paramecium pentaurelia]